MKFSEHQAESVHPLNCTIARPEWAERTFAGNCCGTAAIAGSVVTRSCVLPSKSGFAAKSVNGGHHHLSCPAWARPVWPASQSASLQPGPVSQSRTILAGPVSAQSRHPRPSLGAARHRPAAQLRTFFHPSFCTLERQYYFCETCKIEFVRVPHVFFNETV